MPKKSAQPTENKPTRHRAKTRNHEQQSPPGDRKSAAVDAEQRALADAVHDLDGRD
jgi:hypothetical protein